MKQLYNLTHFIIYLSSWNNVAIGESNWNHALYFQDAPLSQNEFPIMIIMMIIIMMRKVPE